MADELSFLRREGTRIVDGGDSPILLRGVGLGNWLLPEGYMWLFGPETAKQGDETSACN